MTYDGSVLMYVMRLFSTLSVRLPYDAALEILYCVLNSTPGGLNSRLPAQYGHMHVGHRFVIAMLNLVVQLRLGHASCC
jgi:hypothetical protein